VLRMLGREEAATILARMGQDEAGAALLALGPGDTHALIALMRQEPAVTLMAAVASEDMAFTDEVVAAGPADVARKLEFFDPACTARLICKFSGKARNAVTKALAPKALAEILPEINDDDMFVDIVSGLADEGAANVLAAMEPEKLGDILLTMDPETAGDVVGRMRPADAAVVIETMAVLRRDESRGLVASCAGGAEGYGRMLELVVGSSGDGERNSWQGAQLMSKLQAATAADILSQLDGDVSCAAFALFIKTDAAHAARTMYDIEAHSRARLLESLHAQHDAALGAHALELLDAPQALEILRGVSTETRAAIMDGLPKDMLEAIFLLIGADEAAAWLEGMSEDASMEVMEHLAQAQPLMYGAVRGAGFVPLELVTEDGKKLEVDDIMAGLISDPRKRRAELAKCQRVFHENFTAMKRVFQYYCIAGGVGENNPLAMAMRQFQAALKEFNIKVKAADAGLIFHTTISRRAMAAASGGDDGSDEGEDEGEDEAAVKAADDQNIWTLGEFQEALLRVAVATNKAMAQEGHVFAALDKIIKMVNKSGKQVSAEIYAPAFEELRNKDMEVVLEDRSAQIQRAFFARARSVDEDGGPAMEYNDWTTFCRKANIIGQKVLNHKR